MADSAQWGFASQDEDSRRVRHFDPSVYLNSAADIAAAKTRAAEEIARGDFAHAELICRNVLRTDPRDRDALFLIGTIAARLGLWSFAALYFKIALRFDPAFQPALSALASAEAAQQIAAAKSQSGGASYLVLKAWGAGFWSDVNETLAGFFLAELTGRTPVTHWGSNSLFSDGGDGDAFQLYFRPVSEVGIAALAASNASIFPPKYAHGNLGANPFNIWEGEGARLSGLYYLGREDAVAVCDYHMGILNLLPWVPRSHSFYGKSFEEIYRALTQKYLRPQPDIAAEVDAFCRDHIDGRGVLAVHVRGTDKAGEFAAESFEHTYFGAIDARADRPPIFLLTDDERYVDIFRRRYGERVLLADAMRLGGDTGVHFQKDGDPVRRGKEVVKDAYIALRCAAFIGNGWSNVSASIALMKAWGEERCTLLAPSILHVPMV